MFSRNLAFIIGINNYKNGISSLKTAVNDAKKLVETLREKHNYQVWEYLDEVATLSNFNQLLEKTLPEQVTENDRLLFYFAGHGVALNDDDGPAGYLIPQDASQGDTDSYLPMTKLHDALNKLPCRHFLGIFDCCFSGAFRWSSTRDLLATPEVIHKERYDRFISDAAWQIITSSASDQKALDNFKLDTERPQVDNHSPFAAALLEALEGAADAFPPAIDGNPSGDGVITANELYSYVRDRVEIPTEKHHLRQTPGIWSLNKHDKGEYIFLSPGHELNLPPAPPLDKSKNPYRGLKSFEEEHSELFFGRSELVEKLQTFIKIHPLTLVLGASGSGKSSLVKAGLIPELKKETNKKWCILSPIRPGEKPFQALNNALLGESLPLVELQQQKTLTQSIAAWTKNNPNFKLLIFIDQSEEIITLCQNDNERQEFFQQILKAINAHRHILRVVLTLRSDFEPQTGDAGLRFVPQVMNQLGNTELKNRWQSGRFIVPAMTRGELREAIEKPAEGRVMYFQPHDLVEQLIDEVDNMPGALPLLSFALSELFLKYLKRQRDAQYAGIAIDRALNQADYEELGGVMRSLTQRADEEYQALVRENPAYEQVIRHVMLRMVALTGCELARRRVPLSELEYPPDKNILVKEVIERFTEARLLVRGKDSEGNLYVEPAHDALVRAWEKLQTWLTKEKNLSLQRRLTPSAFEWNNGRQVKFLWNTNPYLDVLDKEILKSSDNNWLNQIETEFVQYSLRKRRKNHRRLAASVSGVILGLSGFAIFAGYQWRQAEIGIIEALTQSSKANFTVNRNSFDALIDVLTARKHLQQLPWGNTEQKLQANVLTTLAQSANWVREQNRLQGHQETVAHVSFSPDGQMLATASYDKTVKLWRRDGSLIKTLKGHTEAVTSVSFSPDGKMIASGSLDGKVILWDSNGNFIRVIPAHKQWVMSVSFSSDGRIATASKDQTAKLWRVNDGQLLHIIKGHQQLVRQVSFSPKGDGIITVSDDTTVKLWSRDGKKLLKTLDKHSNAVRSINGSKDGKIFATGSDDKTVKLWSREGQLIKSLEHPEEVWSVSVSRDGQIIASGSKDGTVRLWARDGRLLDTWAGHGESITNVTFSPDGKIIATASNDRTIKLWQVNRSWLSVFRHEQQVNAAKFSPGGKLIASGSDDGKVRLSSREGKPLWIRKGHENAVSAVSFSPNGNTIASGGYDDTIKLWGVDGQLQKTLKGHKNLVNSVSFSNDGKTIASASSDQTAKLWNLDGKEPITLKGHKGRVLSVAFSPDGKTIATAGDDETVKLWNSKGGKELQTLKGHTSKIWSVAFSPDGTTIITASGDKTIKLWQRDGKVKTLKGQEAAVYDASFSPDGKTITSASSNGEIKLWQWNGKLITTLIGHTDAVQSVSFSHDSKWLASAGEDKVVLLWNVSDISPEGLLKKGCSHIHDYLQTQSNSKKLCN